MDRKYIDTIFGDLKSRSGLKVGLIVFVLCICIGLFVHLFFSILLAPVDSNSPTEELVNIRSGMNATEIGAMLEKRGFIRSVFVFRIANLINGTSRSLKAGDYFLSRDMSTFQILDKIASGESVLYAFTIPEGVTLSQIAQYWEDAGFGTAEDFLKATDNAEMRGKYDISYDSMEGYLFPDTYMLPHGISALEAIDGMLHQFAVNMSELTTENSGSLSRHEVISLASIIEKEAKVEEEKPIISAVFHNRLKRGLKLESCATVRYSLGYPRRKLTYEDLKNTKSPYNTYINKGLPPGPICNPGRGAIAAALNPSDHRYLYFVSKNNGTHYFTESYNDFLNAKRRYRDG